MKSIVKILFVGILMLVAAVAINAGDMLFQDGGLNVSQDLRVSTNALYVNSASGLVGIGTTSPNATLTVKIGGTTIADEWTVRSDRDLKEGITELNVNSFNISNAKIYRYKFKYGDINQETNLTEQKLSRERVGLMRDEVPEECRTANQGVDTYCLLSIAYAKIAKLESEVEILKNR